MTVPILSIVIPTRNRHSTLRIIVDSIMRWPLHDFELIIHDNSDNPAEFRSLIDKYRTDERLVYKFSSRSLTLIENSSEAISLARGEYVCFIGDDDGLIPSTVKLCRWLNENNYDSASFDRGHFIWPDLQNLLGSENAARGPLVSPTPKKQLIEFDPKIELRRFLNAGVTNYQYRGPAPYNGIVRKLIYDGVLTETGSYFPAPTPDISSMVSASILANRHAHIMIPFICGGISSASAGGLGRRGLHVGEIADIGSLPANTGAEWTPELPFFWSGFTINAESALKTLTAFEQADLIDVFNFNRNLAACLIYLPSKYRQRTLAHIREHKNDAHRRIDLLGVLGNIPSIYMARAEGFLRRKMSHRMRSFHGDMDEVLGVLQSRVERRYPEFSMDSDQVIDF